MKTRLQWFSDKLHEEIDSSSLVFLRIAFGSLMLWETSRYFLNGWIEKEVKKIDDLFFKLTGNKQRLKFDYRKDGKLDVSFVRMDRKALKNKGWNMSYPDYFLQKNGD